MRSAKMLLLLTLTASGVFAQGISRDDRIKPEQLGLPKGTKRTSEPFVTRIYKTDAAGTILKEQPKGYPFTITEDYILKEEEESRTHQGVDFSSRPSPDEKPTPLDFKAGVHGVVVKAGDGPWGTITVQVWDGTLIQYLHGMASHVKVGDIVAPDTKLGITGRTGAGVIHLHIQAKDKFGNAISPDLAFRLGHQIVRRDVFRGLAEDSEVRLLSPLVKKQKTSQCGQQRPWPLHQFHVRQAFLPMRRGGLPSRRHFQRQHSSLHRTIGLLRQSPQHLRQLLLSLRKPPPLPSAL